MSLDQRHPEIDRRRRTAPSRIAERRQEELRYRSHRMEASYMDNYDDGTTEDYDDFPDEDRRISHRPGSRRNTAPTPSYHRNTSGRTPRRTARKRKPIWLFLVCFFLIGGVLFGAWRFLHKQLGPKYWTLAIFGVDSRNGNLEKGALSDVIMLASINNHTGDIKMTSVYRDTYLRISQDGEYHKLNEAYFKGGHEQAVKALEDNFDLKIDDYATFNWSAVAKGINALGGVDLDISDKEFAYINAFITETVNSTGLGSVQLSHSGMNHLDGVQAVAYGRLRLMDTDFNRTARQRKVLSLAMEKAKQSSKKTLANTALYVLPDVSTSIGPNEIMDIAGNMKNFNLGEATGFPFARTTKKIGKMDCVIPGTLESNVIELHSFLYGEDAADYTPSQTVIDISNHIKKKSGVTEPLDHAPEAKIGGGTGVAAAAPAPAKSNDTVPAKQTESPEAVVESESVPEASAEESQSGNTEPEKEDSKASEDTDRKESTSSTEEPAEFGPQAPEQKTESEKSSAPQKKEDVVSSDEHDAAAPGIVEAVPQEDPDDDMGAGPVAG